MVGVHGAEDQFHHLGEQLIDIEDVADGVGGLVKCGEAGEASAEPVGGGAGGAGEDLAAAVGGNGANDGGGEVGLGAAGEELDALGEFVARPVAPGGEHQDRLADGDGVAAAKIGHLHRLAVEQCAVAATQIDELEAAAGGGTQFEVAAGNLGVVQGDGVRGVPADRDRVAGQVELLPLVHPANDDQSGHSRVLRATPLP